MKQDKNQRIRSMVKFIGDKAKENRVVSEVACDSEMDQNNSNISQAICSSDGHLSKKVSFTKKNYYTKIINARNYLSQNDMEVLERKLKI